MPSRKRHSSVDGCCICGVDNSSEPFVQSDDISANKSVSSEVYQYCFKIGEERSGDLCVDCLSIAKRWLKISKSKRRKKDFSEVVDSKRTPRSNSARKRSRRNSSISKENDKTLDLETTTDNDMKLESPSETNEEDIQNDDVATEKEETPCPVIEDGLSEDENDAETNDEMDIIDSPTVEFETPCLSPGRPENISENSVKREMISVATQTAFLFPALTSPQANANKLPFIDLSKWRQEDICCGTIFRGPNGEVLVDPKWLRSSCEMCNRSSQPPTPVEKTKSQNISVFDEKLSSLCS